MEEFNPWIGKILWRGKWQPFPVLLPGKSRGQRSLVGYYPWGHKKIRHDWIHTQDCFCLLYTCVLAYKVIWICKLSEINFHIEQDSSVQFSHSVMCYSLQSHELQHARLPCPSPTHGVHLNPCHWVGDAIQPSHPLSSPSPPALNLFQHQGLFKWVSSSHQVTKVLEF